MGPEPAQAAEVTRVVSAGDEDNPYDLHISLSFLREARKAALRRESISPAGQGVRQRDLIFRESRNLLNVRMDVGLLPDVGAYLYLPFVIGATSSLSFDEGVDASSSSLLRDGVLPGFGQNTFGLDAPNGRPFTSPSDKLFEAPTRQGLEVLAFGFNWAMFNQRRVPSEPTWLVGAEARVDVSKTMRFDPARPTANTAVGPGYHQLLVTTMASRRFGALEPYVGGHYMFPIKTASSPFERQGQGGDAFSDPQQRARVEAGLEATVWARPEAAQSISLELRLHLETRFRGLARSELWQPLSGSSACPTDMARCRPGLDDVDLDRDGEGDRNPGITRSPTYGIFGGDLGLNVRTGEHVRFRGLFGLTAEQARHLSDGRSGYALFDAPGRRVYVQDAFGYALFLDGALLF
ncbi:MAG: hypothetical protein KA712_23905 [Myxococcales bacterium]|nr:hypothetical protein [Myxococcales bacterium]